MIKTLLLCLLALIGLSAAALPQVGDNVLVGTTHGNMIEYISGNVTGFGDGLLCLNCTSVLSSTTDNLGSFRPEEGDYPYEICIGTAQIFGMRWAD